MTPHHAGTTSSHTVERQAPSGFIDKRSGQSIGTREPLVMRKPNGGWLVNFTVNGVPMTVAGTTAADAISKERKVIADNRLEDQWNEEEAWRQANLQWLDNTHPKYHRIEITEISADFRVEAVTWDGKTHPPSEWGSIAWKWLGLQLAADRYNPSRFIATFKEVVDLLNPSINPTLGCPECHAESSRALARLQSKPPKTAGDARMFLWSFHNSVSERIGKEPLSFEEAETANFWR